MNIFNRITRPLTWLTALLLAAGLAGCGGGNSAATPASSAKAITNYTFVGYLGATVLIIQPTGTQPGTITVTLPAATPVTALVARFVTTGKSVTVGGVAQVSDITANNFSAPVIYTVQAVDGTTANYNVVVNQAPAVVTGPAICTGTVANCVNLGTAANFVIFGKSGITNIPTSVVTGNLGSAAAAGTITGFVKTLDPSGTFSTDPQVTGKIYAFDYTSPTPGNMTTASNDVVAAYGLAAGKTGGAACPGAVTPGNFSGLTLVAGVYKCTANVTMPTNLILNGTATDVWVFQFSGTLTQSANMQVQLTGGALPQNVFWQVAGAVSVGTGALMQGVILGATNIDVLTGATVKGRLLAQTAVNLQSATVTQP